MYVYDINGGSGRPVTPAGVVGSLISPSGESFIAADAQGTNYLYPVNAGEARPIPGLNDDREKIARWSADGHALYVFHFDELPIKVFRFDLATGRRELFKEVMPADLAGMGGAMIFLTPDGKGYIYSAGRQLSTLYAVDGLK